MVTSNRARIERESNRIELESHFVTDALGNNRTTWAVVHFSVWYLGHRRHCVAC